jgi:hypothetical protein
MPTAKTKKAAQVTADKRVKENRKKATAKPEPKPTAKPEPTATKKGKAFPKKAGGEGQPGVIASIIEFLTAATAKKPITKKVLVEKLLERFPDRGEVALMRTCNCQIPSRLRKERELDVQRGEEGGYFIAK